jgi:hypothetical protein
VIGNCHLKLVSCLEGQQKHPPWESYFPPPGCRLVVLGREAKKVSQQHPELKCESYGFGEECPPRLPWQEWGQPTKLDMY